MQPQNSNAIIVLGMHRSGTSALTRVLNLLGIELGDKLLPKHITNETGFWEHEDIVDINEQILQQLDSSWFDTTPLPAKWWTFKSLIPFRYQLKAIISNNFSTLWAIKDPRLCRLLPFWIPLLQELKINPHFIIIARHPFEVAASLEKRDGLSYNTSLRLWLEHVLASVENSQSFPRTFITYDELLQNWPTVINKIAQNFNIEWPHIDSKAIDTFLNPNLKHHVPEAKAPYINGALLEWSQAVYKAIAFNKNIEIISRTIRTSFYSNSRTNFQPPQFHLLINIQKTHNLSSILESLHSQIYTNWFLSIIADFSCTEMWNFPNVRWIQVKSNKLVIEAINHESRVINAEWIALIEAGDSFEAELLSLCLDYINNYPNWQLIYVDETYNNKALYKPDFNLDLLRSTPYLGSFCLLKQTALQQVGGYITYLENYDITWKIIEHYSEEAIGHIPKLLYKPANSSIPSTYKKILQEHLQRQNIKAQVCSTEFENIYWIDYALQQNSFVSIIINTRNGKSSLQRCLNSLLKITSYLNYEIIIVDYHSDEVETLTYLEKLQFDSRIKIGYQTLPELRGEYLLFLNDDTEIIKSDWLQGLLALNQRPEIGIVAARILDSQQQLLHAGYILGMGSVGVAGQINQGLATSDLGYTGYAQATQNFSAVADSCFMISKELYQQIGGMDTNIILFNEVDLCLKVRKANFKIVWTPNITLLQHGVGSLVRNREEQIDNAKINQEITTMYKRWLPQLSNDPVYNPNLSLNSTEWQPETQVNVPWTGSFSKVKRVVAFPHDSWGCGEYRVRTPLRVLQQFGMLEFALMPNDDMKKQPTLTELERMQADILLLHNTLHDVQLNALQQYKHFNHCFKIFGQDDLIYALPKLNPYRKTNYKDIKQRVILAISLCDRLLVTTEPLCEAYRHISNDIIIVPNYIEYARWKDLSPQRLQGCKPRVGWAGAAQHHGDLKLISPLVKELANEVEWIFLGQYPKELQPHIHESYDMVPFNNYPAKLASLNLDLAIAPLETNDFNEAKSNLRLLEYGILGYPVVCSDIYPYQNAPVKQVSDKNWVKAVRERIYDLEATFKEGQELKQWVIKNWLLEDHVTEWATALNCSQQNYRSNFSSTKTNWIFILGDDCLVEILNKHIVKFDINKLSIPNCDLLWTESPLQFNSISIPNESASHLLVTDFPAAMAKTVLLQRNFPNAHFIHVVRNGYQVALEIREQAQEYYGLAPLLLNRAANQWQRSIEILHADVPKLQHFLEIRYEDLMANPQKVVTEVYRFLHITSFENILTKAKPLVEITPEQRAIINNNSAKMLNYFNY